jgi:hypothetical protein
MKERSCPKVYGSCGTTSARPQTIHVRPWVTPNVKITIPITRASENYLGRSLGKLNVPRGWGCLFPTVCGQA